jgi:hypothetical protein
LYQVEEVSLPSRLQNIWIVHFQIYEFPAKSKIYFNESGSVRRRKFKLLQIAQRNVEEQAANIVD